MANTWAIAGMTAGIGGCLVVLGWILNPTISWKLSQFFAALSFDTPKKLRLLEIHTIPKLKEMLRGAVKQRMVRSAQGEGSNSDLEILDKLVTDLRSALYEAEDILDLIDYHRLETQVVNSDAEQSSPRYLDAFIARCRDFTFGPCGDMVQTWCSQLGKFAGAKPRRRVSPAQPPTPLEPSNSLVVKSRDLVVNLISWCKCVLVFLAKAVRSLFSVVRSRWRWEQVPRSKLIKKDYSFLPITVRISLRDRICQIEHIVNDSETSHLLSNNDNIQEETRYSYTSRVERKVFGRDKDRKDICRMLRAGPLLMDQVRKPYSVIGIYGIAGSGKSTLARYVCDYENDEDDHFRPVMFILVSTRFSVGDILRDMLNQIDGNRPSDDRNLESLKEELRGKLKGRRFLLVLDDLWVNKGHENEKDLGTLLDLLDRGQIGSKILVTAQNTGAAAALYAKEQISIPDLKEEEYLTLFMHHALPGNKIDHDGKFERVGRKIAAKLHRSPIAAAAVAQGLRKYENISSWERTANLNVLNKTMGALWWSYDQLGVDTRQCFEYCSIFPRGYKLQRDELVRMWIAQGFVKTINGSEDMEDEGQHYIDELLAFSFFEQLPRTDVATEYIIIHDLLHELAERVSGSDFFRIDVNASPKNIPPNVHHLFIETYERTDIKDKDLELANLRTLIIEEKFPANLDINPHKYDLPSITSAPQRYELAKEEVFQSIFKRLRKLRLLIVEVIFSDTIVFSVPESIGQMKHLRYIGFRPTDNPREIIFPSTFNRLHHMQILDCPLWKVSCPENMTSLKHLWYISGYGIPNIGMHKGVQTLPSNAFVVGGEGYEIKQLKHLNKLRGTLEIHGLGNVGSAEEAREANLALKKRLKELSLNFSGHIVDPNVQAGVLESLCPPEQIEKLNIWNYNGARYPSWILSFQHPDAPKHLYELEFSACSQLVSIPEDSAFFNHLRSLHIAYCDWDSLPENMECLTKLKTLLISHCNNIELLPNLPFSLQRIQIMGKSSVLWESCQEEEHENWRKIKHILTKDFY